MQRIEKNKLLYYRQADWRNVKHGIFTRRGGKSAAPWDSLNVGGTVGDDLTHVAENHQLMYEALDVNAERACTVWQVHGGDVVMAFDPIPNRKWLAQVDSVITDRPDTPLVMRFADCLPILFYDPQKNAIGLAHAGWRGTVAGVAGNTVKAMVQGYGSRPEDIEVVIGPGISQASFQVGEEVVDALRDYYGDDADSLIQRDPNDGTAYVDLPEANAIDLRRAGVENIEVMGICTYQNTDEFFSHRAEKGNTGRFGVVMSL